MDNAGNDAVVKILEQAGVQKLRFSASNQNEALEILSSKPLTAEEVAHGEAFVGEFLEHFGVKGMRWGVRRSRKQLARASKLREKADKAEAKAGGKSAPDSKGRKKVSDLSDADLRQKLNRMQMEKQYKDLTSPKGSPIASAGKKIASNVVKGVTETTLKNVGQSYATKYTSGYMAKATATT